MAGAHVKAHCIFLGSWYSSVHVVYMMGTRCCWPAELLEVACSVMMCSPWYNVFRLVSSIFHAFEAVEDMPHRRTLCLCQCRGKELYTSTQAARGRMLTERQAVVNTDQC